MSQYAELIDREKQPLYDGLFTVQSRRLIRLVCKLLYRALLLIIIALGFHYVYQLLRNPHAASERPYENGASFLNANGDKIMLEAHMMSMCPDAQDCFQQLIMPIMLKTSAGVHLTLSYIGSIDSGTNHVQCMHGPDECSANIIQLCAQEIYKDSRQYIGFTNCIMSDYEKIPSPELIEDCADENNIDIKLINDCTSQNGIGAELLRQSVSRSQENNVTKSCTIRLDDKVRCIRDYGEWVNCPGGSTVDDLVHDIRNLYKEKNTPLAAQSKSLAPDIGNNDAYLQEYKMQLMLLEAQNKGRRRKLGGTKRKRPILSSRHPSEYSEPKV